MPRVDLRQLLRLTDDTGIFQHAVYAAPDPKHGYCIDDNARALIAALLHAQLMGHDDRLVPLHRYLAFLIYAFNDRLGRFRNFMGYDRRWLEEAGSHDSQGRTLWALGLTVQLAPDNTVRGLAENLFRKALPAIDAFEHRRSWAFALLGLDGFLRQHPEDDWVRSMRDNYAKRLLELYEAHASDDWPWWEDVVTYDNAKLSHAMLLCGQSMQRQDMLDIGLRTLRWLLEVQTSPQGRLSIIGNNGWLPRGGEKAPFDQQPLEAYALVHACLDAALISGDERWADHAWWCFEWFRGLNDLGEALVHEDTGGCQDGLMSDGPNRNQGAESTLAYLLSVLELHLYQRRRGDARAPASTGAATASRKGRPTAKRAAANGGRDKTAKRYTLHVFSDATASLASHLIHAILTQFPNVQFEKVFHPFQDSPEKIEATISRFNKRNTLVVHSLVDPACKTAVGNACHRLKIPHYDLTGYLVQFIADHTGVGPVNELSRLHQVDAGYFQRIEAMEYTAQHDDGRGLSTLGEADLVLVGLSRVSKTPTATFLGSQGYKVANVSITPVTGFPKELNKVKRKIVALTVQPKALHEVRKKRVRDLGNEGSSGDYANLRSVIEEVVWAEKEYRQRGYPILDITGMTIEKTATSILQLKRIKQRGLSYA